MIVIYKQRDGWKFKFKRRQYSRETSAPRGFFRVLRFFPFLKNQHFHILIRSWNARAFLNEFGAPRVNKLHLNFSTYIFTYDIRKKRSGTRDLRSTIQRKFNLENIIS